jgi:hypothetical protein
MRRYPALILTALLHGCAAVVAYPITAASVGTTVATGRSPTDHALSETTDQDCSLTRVLDGQAICEKRLKPEEIPVQDKTRKKKVVEVNE